MKRVFLAISLFIAVVLAGCSRTESPASARVIFAIGDITSGYMGTKATVTEFLRGIQLHYTPELTITSKANQAFSIEVNAGESVEIPVGDYHVTATYRKSVIGSVGGYSVAEEPMFVVDEDVTVRPGQVTYFLTGVYTCWALVINYVDTDHYMMDGNTFNMVKGDENRKGVLFISTTEPGMSWSLIAYPKDAVNYEAKTYTIGENEAGYWYCYSPAEVESLFGIFNVNLPDWIEHQ